MEAKFYRLLTAYEKLTVEETTALRERNFVYFSNIRETKPRILPELLELATALDIKVKDPSVTERMLKIIETGQANTRLVEGYIAELTATRQNAIAAAKRLKSLSTIYSSVQSGDKPTAYAA